MTQPSKNATAFVVANGLCYYFILLESNIFLWYIIEVTKSRSKMLLSFDNNEEPKIHPNALQHLEREQVLDAWFSIQESVPRNCKDEPIRWLSVGFANVGAVELISIELRDRYMIIHANKLQKKFWKEVQSIKRRM